MKIGAVVVVLVVATIPTVGAACIPLWVLADRECRRVHAAGLQPSRDAVMLRDVSVAGTVVFVTCCGLMALYALHFSGASGRG